MPYPTSTFVAHFIGEGVFENDAAFRAVSYLDELAGLDKLTPTASANGDKVVYSLHAGTCSSTEARELVRSHLDSGVLHKLTTRMVSNFFNPLSVKDYTCGGFVPVILGACAMSHGCRSLYTSPGYEVFFKTYKDMLIGILTTAPLMDAAKEQMKKALLGPDGFEPGTPIDFKRFARPNDYVPRSTEDACTSMMLGGAPSGYMPAFEKAGGDDDTFFDVGPCVRKDMHYSIDATHCGGCLAEHATLICAKCRNQVYCSKTCQRKDFKRHKNCCRTPEDAESMKDDSLWRNPFFVSKQAMLDALNVFPVFKTGPRHHLAVSGDIMLCKLSGMESARHFDVLMPLIPQ
jgi:hypothetical protein